MPANKNHINDILINKSKGFDKIKQVETKKKPSYKRGIFVVSLERSKIGSVALN